MYLLGYEFCTRPFSMWVPHGKMTDTGVMGKLTSLASSLTSASGNENVSVFLVELCGA
jgi:hypothetical protein